MKIIISFSLVFVAVMLNSIRKKEIKGSGSSDSGKIVESCTNYSTARTLQDNILPSDANAEMVKINNDIQNPDFKVAIIDNPNYGKFSLTPMYDIMLSGKTDPGDNASIALNDNVVSQSLNGQWFLQKISLKSYIGAEVNVKIKQSSTLLAEQNI